MSESERPITPREDLFVQGFRALVEERAVQAMRDGSKDPRTEGIASVLGESLSIFAAMMISGSPATPEDRITEVTEALRDAVRVWGETTITDSLVRRLNTRVKELRQENDEALAKMRKGSN